MQCPSDAELAVFATTREGSDAALATHVATCRSCTAALRELAADDAFLGEVKAALAGGRADQTARDAALASLPGFHILGRIGEGGMGVVYEAEQLSPRRRVAVKLVRGAGLSVRARRRLELEAETLARLQHPGVAQVYAAGTLESPLGPQPYFAMELVRGVPLGDYAGRSKGGAVDLRRRLRLFVEICAAVHHAHQKGVIHRDLKPSNVLVTEDGRPKVLDFGVARLVEEGRAPGLTRSSEIVGTLAYMSPEQAGSDAQDVDARADVYGLGALLYELLSGRPPHDIDKKPLAEAVRAITDGDPVRLGALDARLRGDVETIVHKAMAKDRAERYDSAAELMRDVERFLAHEPIAARAPSGIYRVHKFVRRHRALTAGVLAVWLALLSGLVATLVQRQRALDAEKAARAAAEESERKRAEAEEERALADATRDFLQEVLIQASPAQAKGQDPTVREAFDVAVARVEKLKGRPVVEAAIRHTIGRVHGDAARYDDAAREIERSLALLEAVHGPRHKRVAYVLTSLSTIYERAGRFAEAESAIERVLSMRDLLEGKHDLFLATALNGLAIAHYRHGRHDKAEQRMREAIETYRRVQGEGGTDVAITLGNLAQIVAARGDPVAAERLFGEAVELQRQAIGDENPFLSSTLINHADLLEARGDVEAAEARLREALAICTAKLDEKHDRRLNAQRCLGALLVRRGARDAGLALLRPAYERASAALPATHVLRLRLAIDLAIGLTSGGSAEQDEARGLLDETLRAASGGTGPVAAAGLDALHARAGLSVLRGDEEQARRDYEAFLAAFQATTPAGKRRADQTRAKLEMLRDR